MKLLKLKICNALTSSVVSFSSLECLKYQNIKFSNFILAIFKPPNGQSGLPKLNHAIANPPDECDRHSSKNKRLREF